jgi:hypothetical protein
VNASGDTTVGLIVVRVWTEGGGQLRFRITQTANIISGQTATTYAASKAEVLNEVRAWIESLAATR